MTSWALVLNMNKRNIEELPDVLSRKKKRTSCTSSTMEPIFGDHERRHLVSTNNELADFVRRSVAVIQFQSSEIERLHKIINK